MRLNRFLSASGAASRRKGEELIRDGRLRINGAVVTDPARDVDPERDQVTLDGAPLRIHAARRYLLLNKPMGVIVSVGDTHGRATVMDRLGDAGEGLFPVGRLDRDTSGVLLLTDDGDLAHRLMHPSFGVDKVYRATVAGRVGDEAVRQFREGMELDDGPAAPAEMKVLEVGERRSQVEVRIHQGRKRQVRRMLDRVGHHVLTLERISFGGLTVAGIPVGRTRSLTTKEVARLRRLVGLGPAAGNESPATGTKS